MTQELRWKSNNQRVAARAFSLLRVTDLPDGSQKVEVMPDLKTGNFVEVYLASMAPPPPPPTQAPVSGVAVLHAEVP